MLARGRYQVTRVLLRRGATEHLRDAHGKDATDYARHQVMGAAAAAPAIALLADFRAAGGTWKKYSFFPSHRMLELRVLCLQGRATAPDGPVLSARAGLLPRLFSSAMPRDVFWLVLTFWNDRTDSA